VMGGRWTGGGLKQQEGKAVARFWRSGEKKRNIIDRRKKQKLRLANNCDKALVGKGLVVGGLKG